jgi:hypothetical protein
MKGKKVIFFIAAFLLPIAVFIFLKVFGHNEFRVPPLFQDGVIDAPTACGYAYSTPYTVPDSIIAQLGIDKRDSLYVIYFDPSIAPPMRRAAAEYADASVKLIGPSDIPADINKRTLQQCALLMKPEASVVLLDHLRRIRGQYNGSSRDDVDRLLVEIDIILKNY